MIPCVTVVPEGRLGIAHQFTGGTATQERDKSRRDGWNCPSSSLLGNAYMPNDESLGNCQPSLRDYPRFVARSPSVETLGYSQSSLRDCGAIRTAEYPGAPTAAYPNVTRYVT